MMPPPCLLIVILFSPLHCWVIVHAQNEVGQQLEKVLPQQERDKEGEVAYVYLAAIAGKIDVADAIELVELILAQAPVEAWIRVTFINVHFTPAG